MFHIEANYCKGDFGAQPLHCHEDVEFIAVVRGRGTMRCGRAYHVTGPGILSLVRPGEPHAGAPQEPEFEVQVLNVPAAWFTTAETPYESLGKRNAVCENPGALTAFFQTYNAVSHHASRLTQETATLDLCAAIQERATDRAHPNGADREPKRIAEAVSILQERFADDLSLTELAGLVELAPAYLCRAFKKSVGLPPHAYQISLRVARAKTLLSQGVTPAESARAVGFYDQSHLTMHFRRLLGVTPRHFR